MKTSFNFEGYRKELADELRNERLTDKDKALEMLNEKAKSPQYEISKNLKNLSQKLEVDNIGQYFKDHDLKGMNQYDISESIPENIKLSIDNERHYVLEKKYASEIEYNKEELANFLNEITNGAYLSREKMIHVINADGADNVKLDLHRLSTNTTKEAGMAIAIDELRRDKLYVSSGGSAWMHPERTLVILDPKSKRFQDSFSLPKSIADMRDFDVDQKYYLKEKGVNLQSLKLVDWLSVAHDFKTQGILIDRIKDGITWFDFAEYIVDLQNGKMYHFENKSSKEITE
jgi:hypothetical protein